MKLKEIAAQLRAAANSYPDAITPATFQDAAMRKAHDEVVAAQQEHRAEFRFETLHRDEASGPGRGSEVRAGSAGADRARVPGMGRRRKQPARQARGTPVFASAAQRRRKDGCAALEQEGVLVRDALEAA